MEPALAALAAWLDAAGFDDIARGDAYPVANTLHLLGLVMLVGGIGVVDLRVAGLWRPLPAGELARALTPVALIGLVVMIASGAALFAADGPALARSDTFRLKLTLVLLALANAGAFRWLWRDLDRPPAAARAMAVVSLALWLAAGTAGRMIAYS